MLWHMQLFHRHAELTGTWALGSLTPGGEVDYSSLHGSCPTTKGEKWSATKWIHVSTFGGNVEASKAKWCARG